MKIEKMPRESTLSPQEDIKKQLQTSFCNVIKSDEQTGSILFQVVYGFIIYNGKKNDLWHIKAECQKDHIDTMPIVREYAEKQFKLLTEK